MAMTKEKRTATYRNADVPRNGRREWIGLGVLALACVLYAMDLTILHLAVPKLSATLKPTSTELLWIVDICGFLVAGSLIIAGTLGGRCGRRQLLMIGASMFGVTSALTAFGFSKGETFNQTRWRF
jgi:DHA2 family multidrug resistance protein-like MFS transporter